ncbi:hypothetical protein AVEN_106263-1 [Araneus ventricosus]|uniref:Uncharacterized protein n=1 Tax=Araneus ventricosus TaxID=182803 RepID=A0A4Y2VGQ6_ARAVE|nr:hypothetical protein AVEN_106263-1 [Araneus ventricosus]
MPLAKGVWGLGSCGISNLQDPVTIRDSWRVHFSRETSVDAFDRHTPLNLVSPQSKKKAPRAKAITGQLENPQHFLTLFLLLGRASMGQLANPGAVSDMRDLCAGAAPEGVSLPQQISIFGELRSNNKFPFYLLCP